MPSNATRRRIEWCPGDAAFEALEIGEHLFANLPRQEAIDRLVIIGLCSLRHPPWAPPPLFGDDRDRWKLPESARLNDLIPGSSTTPAGRLPETSREYVHAATSLGILHGKDTQ